jgi:class 3 adenylate cyclase
MSDEPLPRGTVTFLFSDIEGSTELVRQVGGEAFSEIRADHRRLLREAFTAHRGREIDTAGDGFFVAFDSARDAVGAAVSAQLALATFVWPRDAQLRVRMGLHTAEPHLAEDGYVGVGVTRAARICAAARGGQILVSNATAGIVEDTEPAGVDLLDLGEHGLPGLTRPQRLFQLTVAGLPSTFGPLRTSAPRPSPGVGTFLFSDLAGWRHVVRALGDEASAAIAVDYHATMTSAVEANGGVLLERVGDTTLAVFQNAADAVRAAAAARAAVDEFSWPPGCEVAVSIVIHSGRWSGDPDQPAAGTAVLRLYRLTQVVEPRQVLVTQATTALLEGDRTAPPLRSLGPRDVADFDEPVHLYELIEARDARGDAGPT